MPVPNVLSNIRLSGQNGCQICSFAMLFSNMDLGDQKQIQRTNSDCKFLINIEELTTKQRIKQFKTMKMRV